MNETCSIGELARAAEVPTSTVRYYERVGLVRPSGRTAGNFRYYGLEALHRLRFIRAAAATGFTLADIRRLLEFRDGAAAPCKEVQSLIENRLADVDLRDAAVTQRVVPLDEPLIAAARAVRTCFGDQEGPRRSARTRERSADMPLADS